MKSVLSILRSWAVYAALGLFLLPADCLAAAYSVVDLGTIDGFAVQTVPMAINDSGQVVGLAYSGADASFPYHAFLYSNGSIQDLQTLGGSDSAARGINEAGQVVGYSTLPDVDGHQGPTQAFLYDGGVMQPLGGGTVHAADINNLGQIVGDFEAQKNVFLSNGGAITDLGNLGSPGTLPTVAWEINDNGQIVGVYYLADNHNHGFIYTAGTLQDLGTLGGSNSAAFAINSSGQAAGSSNLGDGTSHAFLYDGTIHDLGTLDGGNSTARGLNDLGQAVGTSPVAGVNHAFFYGGSPMLDLNTLIDPNSGWALQDAYAINNLGQITGTGTFNGQDRAFLLTPVPEPGSLALAIAGLVCLAAWFRPFAPRARRSTGPEIMDSRPRPR